LADLALVFVTLPLAEVDKERIFSLRRGIIGIHVTRTELLHAPARIKVHEDIKRHNSINQEQISFAVTAFISTTPPISMVSWSPIQKVHAETALGAPRTRLWRGKTPLVGRLIPI
jgi:hypothetical protein